MSPVTVPDGARQRFVAAFRTRLDDPLAEAGFPLNGVYFDNSGNVLDSAPKLAIGAAGRRLPLLYHA